MSIKNRLISTIYNFFFFFKPMGIICILFFIFKKKKTAYSLHLPQCIKLLT